MDWKRHQATELALTVTSVHIPAKVQTLCSPNLEDDGGRRLKPFPSLDKLSRQTYSLCVKQY